MHIDASGGREERLTWLMDAANQHQGVVCAASAKLDRVRAGAYGGRGIAMDCISIRHKFGGTQASYLH